MNYHDKLKDPNENFNCETLQWIKENWNFYEETEYRLKLQC